MRNAAIYGTEDLLHGFIEALEVTGVRTTSVDRSSGRGGVATVVTAQIGAASIALGVEVKLNPPRSRADVRRRPVAGTGVVNVLVAPFLSPPVRDELERCGWSYWDATGNMRIRSTEPVVWIDRAGASRNPDPGVSVGAQRLRSLKGKAASEVVVRLLSTGNAASVRELARNTGAGVATVSRVIELLRADEVVEVGSGEIHVPDRVALARRWAQDYGFERTFKPERYVSLLGEDIALNRLGRSGLRFAVTGSRAASAEFGLRSRVAPLPATGVWLYSDDVGGVERVMDLAPDRRGNILVADSEFLGEGREGAQDTDPPIARSWRIIGDLLAAGGRMTAIGEELAVLRAGEAAE
ncbi:hypothetical protein [Microbacterium marmarense]|uniref:HTH iclR-type domain-containing protein n=1 Tax=Microbacterium marmarense TaxID=3122051 RepID=A0ABU8LW30_9MICO